MLRIFLDLYSKIISDSAHVWCWILIQYQLQARLSTSHLHSLSSHPKRKYFLIHTWHFSRVTPDNEVSSTVLRNMTGRNLVSSLISFFWLLFILLVHFCILELNALFHCLFHWHCICPFFSFILSHSL